jgi:hypothetical protein
MPVCDNTGLIKPYTCMKKYFAVLVLIAAMLSCQKEKDQPELSDYNSTTATLANAAAVCTNSQYALSLDAIGRGRFFRVTASPSAGTATYTAVNGPCGNNIINGSSITQILKPTGLALANGGITALVTTGINGLAPNRLYTFPVINPCSPTSIPLIAPAGLNLNISDLERNPSNGNYYAINTELSGANEVVQVNVGTGAVTRLTTGSLGALQLKGLTFRCDPANPNAFVYQDNGPTGNIYEIDIVAGSIVSGPLVYGGPVNPNGMVDMGLTIDCICTDYFMTCSGTPGMVSPFPTFTAGMPIAFGGAYAASSTSTLKPTVDFGKW